MRHTFFAAIPVSALLLATLTVALFGPAAPGADALWWAASLAQFGVTLWVLAKWISGPAGGPNHKPNWGAVTPVLFIPIVGNVLAPLAGVPLGHGAWASAPYLHNGSVPTLYDLLLPAKDRPEVFKVGSRVFDAERVGLRTDQGLETFDTKQSGNANSGHEYGAGLTVVEREELLEYLKTL